MAERAQHEMKNCSVYEAAKVILDGTMDDQRYVAQHYPFTTIMVSKAGDVALKVFKGLPGDLSARKFENALIKRLEQEENGVEERDDEVVPTVKPAKPRPKRKRPKEELEDEPEEVEDDEEDEDEEEEESEDNEEAPDYSTMSAMDLYKLCIERGIEAKKRCKAKTYIEMLEKWDAENAKDDDEDEEDEADEEDSEDEDDDDDDWDI